VRRTIALAAVAFCVVVAVYAPTPEAGVRSAARFHDFLHVPGFALVTVLLLVAFPASGPRGVARFRHVVLIFVASVGVGALVELLQLVSGGEFSAGDVLRDAGGASAVLLALAASWAGWRRRHRLLLGAAALLVLIAFASPALGALVDEARARRQFPVLVDFSRAGDMDRFEWETEAPATFVAGDGASGHEARGARVALSPGRYPGFKLRYFPRDWRGFTSFVFSCTNLSNQPLPIAIRIDDTRHNERYRDRFNGSYVLGPGNNEIRVPLAEVEQAPRGRKLDLSQVRSVIFFSYQLKAPRVIIVEGLKLER
jgi:hypothetical protein